MSSKIIQNQFISTHFPQTKLEWKTFWKKFYPLMLSALLFALNGFIDNFMVGHIEQGVASLSAANSWTNIFNSLLMGIATSGSVIFAQFYFSKKFEDARQVSKLRFLIAIIMAAIMATLAWTLTSQLNEVFLKKPSDPKDIIEWEKAINGANEYLNIIAIQWFLVALTNNYASQYREIGHGKISMWWGLGTLSTNITLNSILMYGFSYGVAGAAWASVGARLVALTVAITYMRIKKLEYSFHPWTIFKIDRRIIVIYFRRWFQFITSSTTIVFITFRNYFYDAGYKVGSIGQGVGAIIILGLAGAIMNVFLTTFSALSAMTANFVASELGKGNHQQAKKNADHLKGFSVTMALCMSLILAIFASVLPYMKFLSDSNGVDSHVHLVNVQYALYVVSFWYPIWIWFSVSMRNGLAGGKGNSFMFVDWFVSGPIQLGWLALLTLVIVPSSPILQNNFWLMWFIFFISDLIKLVASEILYYKTHWLETIVHEKTKHE